MKLRIDNFEVEIKAKGLFGKDRYNQRDVMSLLNTISIAFDDAGKYNLENFGHDMGYTKIGHQIFAVLDENGLYEE